MPDSNCMNFYNTVRFQASSCLPSGAPSLLVPQEARSLFTQSGGLFHSEPPNPEKPPGLEYLPFARLTVAKPTTPPTKLSKLSQHPVAQHKLEIN